MKKVISIILGIMVFVTPHFCFATTLDEPSPFFIPYADSNNPTAGFLVTSPESRYIFSDSDSPVYGCFYLDPNNTSRTYYIYFSDTPCNVSIYRVQGNDLRTVNLSNEYNGFYYSSFYGFTPDNVPIFSNPDGLAATGIIDLINSSFFMTTFDLSYLTDGAVSWLSAVVDGVMQEPLLLFLILSSLSGIAIGLFFRFKRG